METTRDGNRVWPTCKACGCRLDYMEYSNTEYKFFHFGAEYWKADARGCKCPNLFQAWVAKKHRVYVGV